MSSIITNKVGESGIITLDLSEFFPVDEPLYFDIAPFLYKNLILKEKDFRASLAELDWNQYTNKTVLVFCSVDAIIPAWASMLVASYLVVVTQDIFHKMPDEWRLFQLQKNLENIDFTPFVDKRVVVKGCGDKYIPESCFFIIAKRLIPVVKSLMYGEPCSTVPVYKKK